MCSCQWKLVVDGLFAFPNTVKTRILIPAVVSEIQLTKQARYWAGVQNSCFLFYWNFTEETGARLNFEINFIPLQMIDITYQGWHSSMSWPFRYLQMVSRLFLPTLFGKRGICSMSTLHLKRKIYVFAYNCCKCLITLLSTLAFNAIHWSLDPAVSWKFSEICYWRYWHCCRHAWCL